MRQNKNKESNSILLERRLIRSTRKLKQVAEQMLRDLEELERTTPIANHDPESRNFRAVVRRFEIALIVEALQRTGGHQKHAAKLLGLGATTLNEMIKRHKIDPQTL